MIPEGFFKGFPYGSDDDAHQPSVAVIDDLLHGILKLHLAFVVDHGDLIAHAVHHQLFDGFSENVGAPYASHI